MDISILKGKILSKIDKEGSTEIIFTTNEGQNYCLGHIQDCCESVAIDDIEGNLDDLIGEEIIQAEEITNIEARELEHEPESFTWTFYKLATKKGFVTIKWLGESNGYYSESVDFYQIAK